MTGVHEAFTADSDIEGSSDRMFGFVFAAFFTLVALWPLTHHKPARFWALPVAAVFLLIAAARPQILSPLNKLWSKLGLLMQKIVNPVVMAILFYLVFTPAGFLMRRMGNDLLHLKYEPQLDTYWISRVPPGPDGASMAHQF